MAEEILGGFGAYPTPGYTPPHPKPRKPKPVAAPPADRPILPTPAGQVRVTSTIDGATIAAWLTVPFLETAADVGNWQVAARDGDTGIPEYVGGDPAGWTFTLRFDGWATRRDLRTQVGHLLNMGRRLEAVRPSPILVTGTTPPSVAAGRWLLAQATPQSAELIDSATGALHRLDVACVLMAPGDDNIIRAPTAAKANRKTPTKRVKPKPHENLLQLLVRVRGTSTGWHDVAARNKIRDPAATLPKHKTLRI